MTLDLRFHPLTEWPAKPTPAVQRKSRWSFRASWNDTLTLLEDELLKLRATDVVVSAATGKPSRDDCAACRKKLDAGAKT